EVREDEGWYEEDWSDPPSAPIPSSTYFDPVDDTARPRAVGGPAGVGSEGLIANLIRDLALEDGHSAFLDHPSIHSMRSVKSPEAFLVDDIIGSGKRALDFADAFADHRTIKSW